jgi:hypothetical protein
MDENTGEECTKECPPIVGTRVLRQSRDEIPEMSAIESELHDMSC